MVSCVIAPLVVIAPMPCAAPAFSVNHVRPSGPGAMPPGFVKTRRSGIGYSLTSTHCEGWRSLHSVRCEVAAPAEDVMQQPITKAAQDSRAIHRRESGRQASAAAMNPGSQRHLSFGDRHS